MKRAVSAIAARLVITDIPLSLVVRLQSFFSHRSSLSSPVEKRPERITVQDDVGFFVSAHARYCPLITAPLPVKPGQA